MTTNEETQRERQDERETCDGWFERYHAYQLELGQYGTRSQWRTWISPRIGSKCWSDVTSDDVEDLRDALDSAILAWQRSGSGRGRISGQTAMTVWWALRGSLREVTSSKRRDLRVLPGGANPCVGVQPPGDKDSRRHRRKTFVYPCEFARLVACADIPLAWREVHAVAAYTYLRPSELGALRWGDVDVEHGRLLVTKARSYRDGSITVPKTRSGVREIPIAPQLLPVLRRMSRAASAGHDDLVVPILTTVPRETLAARTRRHLLCAGVIRETLHTSSRTTVRANFRSWRDSGITWLAMSGLDTAKIMRRAGHDDIGTTIGYVKQSEDLGGELGEPFAPLPDDLRCE